jgi:hypothetical protein
MQPGSTILCRSRGIHDVWPICPTLINLKFQNAYHVAISVQPFYVSIRPKFMEMCFSEIHICVLWENRGMKNI